MALVRLNNSTLVVKSLKIEEAGLSQLSGS